MATKKNQVTVEVEVTECAGMAHHGYGEFGHCGRYYEITSPRPQGWGILTLPDDNSVLAEFCPECTQNNGQRQE